MSAFGQAGFGSMNRRNQLRAQGQMDPYGQQVRAAKQAPTLNIYQTPSSYQQATGQQQAPRQSQPAISSPPSPASPPTTGGSIPASGGAPAPQTGGGFPVYGSSAAPQTGGGFPVYGSSAAPQTGGVMPTYDEVMRQQSSPGTAQPIQPQSQGTPYGADPGYADRVAAAAQQWNSTPAGSQKRDWEGNTVRGMLARGLPPDMAARVLETNSTRYSGNPAGASQFANQTEQDWIASLSSGLPQAPGPNATAAEHSAYLNASNAYGRQQKAQQARDERIAAEAAFNDPARTAAGPSQRYIDTVRRQQMNQGGSALMNPFAYRSQLQAGAIDVFGNPVTGSTQATSGSSSGTPGQAQPIQPQPQGTPYTPYAEPQTGGGFPVYPGVAEPQTGGGFPVYPGVAPAGSVNLAQPQTGGGFPVFPGGAVTPTAARGGYEMEPRGPVQSYQPFGLIPSTILGRAYTDY